MWDEDDIPMIGSSPSPLPKKPKNSVVFLHPTKTTNQVCCGIFWKKTSLKKKNIQSTNRRNKKSHCAKDLEINLVASVVMAILRKPWWSLVESCNFWWATCGPILIKPRSADWESFPTRTLQAIWEIYISESFISIPRYPPKKTKQPPLKQWFVHRWLSFFLKWFSGWWFQPHLKKYARQIGSFPQFSGWT